jgi:phosphoribosylanthranilate isomerase
MRTRIKICGFKTSETIDAAIEAGTDALGFNLFPASVRAIDLQTLGVLTKRVPAFVSIVALFVNPTPEDVRAAIATARIDLLQFHGNESPEFCEQFGKPFMKAFAVDESFDLLKSSLTYSNAAALLLDTPSAGHGGSGKTFNWQLINTTSIADANAPRLVLSGGLTAANVADAVNAVHPFAVDVSSGVESSHGVKDSKLIYEFCAAVPR